MYEVYTASKHGMYSSCRCLHQFSRSKNIITTAEHLQMLCRPFGNFSPIVSSPPGCIEHFLLIQLKSKHQHHRFDVFNYLS